MVRWRVHRIRLAQFLMILTQWGGVPLQRLIVSERGSGRVARGRGPALLLDNRERERVLVGTSHDCVDQSYPGAGGFYAIGN